MNQSRTSTSKKRLLICLICAFTVYSSTILSQISEGGVPPSFHYPPFLRSGTSATAVPIDFNIEDLRETDAWNARDGAPMPVSTLIPVDYTMDNSGAYTVLPGGENIWRLHLVAKDAVAIMLYYSDFYIPEGGRLFIYSPDIAQLLGAYTHRTHPDGGLFATEFIGGDELMLEYVAPVTNSEKPRLSISEIGYGYNTAALRAFGSIATRATSGDCMVNVNCEEGEAWQNEKKSVCYMVQRIGRQAYICTGSLMNNTAQDFRPIILSALHCAYESTYTTIASVSDMEQWTFSFNRERDDCSNNSIGNVSKTMVGCQLLAETGLGGGSDGLLLLLKEEVPDEYDVFYNGWDLSSDAARSGVSIHHPQGDFKKISTYDETIRSYTFQGPFTCAASGHWNVIFKETANGFAVTEEGSSGSPLYNEKKLVIGTLSGGNSSCTYPKGINLYGKLSYHWDKYKADSSKRVDVWLDPRKTGTKMLSGRNRTALKPSPLNLKAVNLGNSVSLSWDAPESNETPKKYNVYRNNIKISETSSLTYIDTKPFLGSLTYSVSAVYDNDEESGFSSSTLFYIKFKAPYDFKAERQTHTNREIELTWKTPVYEQTIYWGSLNPTYLIGFEDKMPFYFGHRWSTDEIEPLHLKTIKAIQFFPIEKNSYDLYITQGEYFYRQPVETSLLKLNEINTINLNTPFVIDGSKSLIISIYTSLVATDHPAVCDDGPAVYGKGNICSDDGIEWFQLNEGEEPGSYDYNFIVTAIVSSESGILSLLSKNTDSARLNSVVQQDNHPSQHRKHALLYDDNPLIRNNNTLQPRKGALTLNGNQASLRNAIPALFPEITQFSVYRNDSFLKSINASETSWTDINMYSKLYYQISAVYDMVESEKSDTAFVAIDYIDDSFRIFPTFFTDFITIEGYENITRIEAISVSGKVSLVVSNPNQQIDASSLPPGLYFFRIYDVYNKRKIVKAFKAR